MRSAFDKLISWAGIGLVAVLLVAGGLLTWANTYINDQVHDQLVMQDITMPEGDALAGLPKADAAALEEFAGSPMDTGPEARAYADHYILVHMNESSDGRTYSEVSGEFVQLSDEEKASAEGQALGQLRQTLFMGSTLRGLLLYGAAFATMGTIAGIGAIVAFGAGAALLVLVGFGFWHARRVGQTEETIPSTRRVPQPA